MPPPGASARPPTSPTSRRSTRRARRSSARSRIRGSASTRSRPTTSRPSSGRSRRAGSARTSSRGANGRRPRRAGVPNARDHARGHRQDAGRPAGGGSGGSVTACRFGGSHSSRPKRPKPWPGSSARGGPRARRPVPAQPGRRARDARRPRGRSGCLQVRDDRDRDRGGHRGRWRSRTARCGRAASICMSGRNWARSMPGERRYARPWRSPRCGAARSTTFDTLDVGGGFPVRPTDEPAPTAERFARELPAILESVPVDRRPTRLAIEPGRALVARSGWLVARVLHVRDRGGRQVVLDAGMTELIRPALYGARHPIVALTSLGALVDPARGTAAADFEPAKRRGPDLRIDRRPRRARPAAAPPRRPRRHRRRRRLRRQPRLDVQRAPATAAGAARTGWHAAPRPSPRPLTTPPVRLRHGWSSALPGTASDPPACWRTAPWARSSSRAASRSGPSSTSSSRPRPELIGSIHREYLAAGADLIETATFGANRPRLAPYGLE